MYQRMPLVLYALWLDWRCRCVAVFGFVLRARHVAKDDEMTNALQKDRTIQELCNTILSLLDQRRMVVEDLPTIDHIAGDLVEVLVHKGNRGDGCVRSCVVDLV